MPTLRVDTDISTFGGQSFGDNSVMFLFVHLDTLGGLVTELELDSPDHILRAGWWALGHTGDVGDGVTRIYWREPHWINTVDSEWTPEPQNSASGDLTVFADVIRWQLSPGTSGHLWLYTLT
jgi:hypothetical protein